MNSHIQENFQSIPNAKSCDFKYNGGGWKCDIDGQFCPPSVSGPYAKRGRTCCNGSWKNGKLNCKPKGIPNSKDTYNPKDIPNAKSCKGWDCSINGQYCPPGVPGSSKKGYTCCNKKWKSGKLNCKPKYILHNAFDCPKGTEPVQSVDCVEAVKSVLPSGMKLKRNNLILGTWGWVPAGCTAQTGGDWAAHFTIGKGATPTTLDKKSKYRKLCYIKPKPKINKAAIKKNTHPKYKWLNTRISQLKNGLDKIVNDYTDKLKIIKTQDQLLNKQDNIIDLKNNIIVNHKNSLSDKKDNIHTKKRELMYDSVYNRRNLIITRILKLILIILSIAVIILLSKRK